MVDYTRYVQGHQNQTTEFVLIRGVVFFVDTYEECCEAAGILRAAGTPETPCFVSTASRCEIEHFAGNVPDRRPGIGSIRALAVR